MKILVKRSSSDPLTWRAKAAAGLGSLIAHVLLLFGVGQLYRSAEFRPAVRVDRSAEVAYVELTWIRQPLPARPTSTRLRDESSAEPSGEESPNEGDAGIAPIAADPFHSDRADASAPSEAEYPLRRIGFRDPRLYVRADSLDQAHRPFRSDAPGSNLRDRLLEEQNRALAKRQIAILGQNATVFGDSTDYRSGLHVDIAGRRAIMPEDGRDWENIEMQNQRDSFARDSILRERIHATRERLDAQRRRDGDL